MKFYLQNLGFSASTNKFTLCVTPDPTPNAGEENGGGGANGKPPVIIENPEGLLNAYNSTKDQLKAFKELGIKPEDIKTLLDFKKTADQAAKDAADKKLLDERNWSQLLENKEKDYQAKLKSEKDTLLSEIENLKNSTGSTKAEKEQIAADLLAAKTELESLKLQKKINSKLKGVLDPEYDSDYFEYKMGSRFSQNDKGELLFDGEIFSADKFKELPEANQFLIKLNPQGTGTKPGVKNTEGKDTFKTSGETDSILEIPSSVFQNYEKLMEFLSKKNISVDQYQKIANEGKIKTIAD